MSGQQTIGWQGWLCRRGLHLLPRRWSMVWISPERKTRYRACACGRRMLYGKQD
jgi:hypothetical protein